MDNYKYAKIFERLAIKIVESQYNCSIDYKKTHTTQATRDYGIDSVIYFTERTIQSSTIEAKLRKSDYTLALKDIASSILFFLVRKGDEHFIVSNVYITSGTLETIELLNLQSQSKIYYISGEDTKNALEKIVDNLSNAEEIELAQLLIQNFKNLKKPQGIKKQKDFSNAVLHDDNLFEVFSSRKEIIKQLEYSIKNQYKIIMFHGEAGTGKRWILHRLNKILIKSNYNTITIDVYEHNTIDTFCYELTRKILGLDLHDIIYMLSENEIQEIKQNLNDLESEALNNIFLIFSSQSLSENTAIYLAKIYLYTLFNKFNQLKYVLEVENFSYTSQEVFDFIKDFSTNLPENVNILLVFTKDLSALHNDFSNRYKQVYYNIIKEIEIGGFPIEESEQYLKKFLPYIDTGLLKQIFNYTNGIPFLLKQVAQELSSKVLFNSLSGNGLLATNLFINRDFKDIFKTDTCILKFFFVLYLYEFCLPKDIWNKIQKQDEISETEIDEFEKLYLSKLSLLKDSNNTYSLQYTYLIHQITVYFENNIALVSDYAKKIKKIIVSGNESVLTKIKLFFYCQDSSIVAEYENKKNIWMYKTNIDWQTSALRYICKFYLQQESEDIQFIIQVSRYYLNYMNLVTYNGIFENSILQKLCIYVNILERGIDNLPTEKLYEVADFLAEFYIYQYFRYKQKSDFGNARTLLENIIFEEWFSYLSDIKKIKIQRFIALIYKSQGNRKKFMFKLNEIWTKYPGNSYAKVIYWANMAARYYIQSSDIALQYLEKCELDIFNRMYPDEIVLYLWVKNDLGIVNFYNNNIPEAKKIAKNVLLKSEKINSLENMARSHNLLGAIALKENLIDDAKKEFYQAFTLCVDEKSESFFHFVVNYFISIDFVETPLIHLVLDYIKSQRQRLLQIFKNENLETCRWYITLCAFNIYLFKLSPELQKELEIIIGNEINLNPSSFLNNYIIQNRLIVLF